MILRLIENDCLIALKEIKNKSIDVVVTSTPYSLNIKYNSYKDDKSNKDYLDWLYNICIQIKRVLKDDGSFFLNIAGSNKKPLLPYLLIEKIQNLFILQNNIIWIKSIAIKDKTYGQFKPINSPRYTNHTHEFIFHLTKTGNINIDRLSIGVPFTDKTNIKRRSHKQDKRCRSNTWFIPYTTRNKKLKHPATFPVKLPEMCIKLHGKKYPAVLDPFVGSGSTGIAALKLKCKSFIGIDQDKTYIDMATARINRYKRKKDK